METNPLRGLFGVSSPRLVEQIVAPQPTGPTKNENAYFEIPSGMMEKLLFNTFAGDGTKHPDEHLRYVDDICGLFKLAGIPDDVVKKKVFPLSLKEDALTWYRLCDDMGSWNYKRLKLEFIRSFILCILFIVIEIIYIMFGLVKDKASLKLGGGLNQCYIHAPIMSSQN